MKEGGASPRFSAAAEPEKPQHSIKVAEGALPSFPEPASFAAWHAVGSLRSEPVSLPKAGLR